MKSCSIVISDFPFAKEKNSEALRMGVGITLADGNRVNVIFTGNGIYSLLETRPDLIGGGEVKKHLDMIMELGHDVIVEKESLDSRDIGVDSLAYDVSILNSERIKDLIMESDVLFNF